MIISEEEKIFVKNITPKVLVWITYSLPFFTDWFRPELHGLFFSEVAIKSLAMFGYIVLGALLAYVMTNDENRMTYLWRGIGIALFSLFITPFLYLDRFRDWLN